MALGTIRRQEQTPTRRREQPRWRRLSAPRGHQDARQGGLLRGHPFLQQDGPVGRMPRCAARRRHPANRAQRDTAQNPPRLASWSQRRTGRAAAGGRHAWPSVRWACSRAPQAPDRCWPGPLAGDAQAIAPDPGARLLGQRPAIVLPPPGRARGGTGPAPWGSQARAKCLPSRRRQQGAWPGAGAIGSFWGTPPRCEAASQRPRGGRRPPRRRAPCRRGRACGVGRSAPARVAVSGHRARR
jgi:hypothetical protein